MGGAIVSRLIVLGCGTLYPAYASYKAVKSANVRLYVRWMMYWIIYALFITVETFTDFFISWLPFYYEIKVGFLIWLLSPYTKGSAFLYRKFLHPFLSEKEPEIDNFLHSAKQKGYSTVMDYGSRGINVATTAFVTAAVKGQAVMSERLKSYSVNDISRLSDDSPIHSMDSVGYNPNIQREILRRSPNVRRRDGVRPHTLHQDKLSDMDINTFEMINPDQPIGSVPYMTDSQHDGMSGGSGDHPRDSRYQTPPCTAYPMSEDVDVTANSLSFEFDTAPPEMSVDDSVIPNATPTFARGDSAYSTLPRQRKSKKKKSEDPEASLRRSNRKVKASSYHESDDEQQYVA